MPVTDMSFRRLVGEHTSHLSHENLCPLDEDGRAGHIKALLEALQMQILHLLIAALHLHWVVCQHRDPLHLLETKGQQVTWR